MTDLKELGLNDRQIEALRMIGDEKSGCIKIFRNEIFRHYFRQL